jgi:uncharacterized protein (TIGR03437 family)
MRRLACALSLVAAAAGAQPITSWDSSGNGMLRGTYRFRNVIWVVGNQRGDLEQAVALYGTITFDGNGNYTITCRVADSSQGVGNCSSAPIPGIYRVSGGGFARLQSPVVRGGVIDGQVWNGTLIASSTEAQINDLFIATQERTEAATAATVSGRFWTGVMDFPSSNIAAARDALFALNFDGGGNVGAVEATGYIGNGASAVTQNFSGVSYSFTSGTGTISFGGTTAGESLVYGSREFYVSQDGNFIFGGLTAGWDMLVGVRAVPGDAPPDLLGGLYFQAGVSSDQRSLASQGYADLETYYSSFIANGTLLVGHMRIASAFSDAAFDYTYSAPYTFGRDAVYEDSKNTFRYVVGAGGGFQVGIGKGPVLGLNVAVKPNFTGTGPYLNPGLILNAASFAPSTAGISRGELLTIYGSNLAPVTMIDPAFPTTLGGVLVLVNSRPAPIYEVSPTRLTVQVPYSLTEETAVFQVIAGGAASNNVMLFTNQATPGVFLPNGKHAAALHADFTLVTPESAAKPGETVLVYLTGLGDVAPAVAAGTPAPGDPLSTVTTPVAAFIDGREAKMTFVGLAPGLIGLYQINVEVPAATAPGDARLDLATPGAYHSSALLPVAAQ